jgi:hypothetical protein
MDEREMYVLPEGNCQWCLTGEGEPCQEQRRQGGTPICPRPFPWEEEEESGEVYDILRNQWPDKSFPWEEKK